MAKREWPRRGNRKDMYSGGKFSVKKAFDYLENQLLDARNRSNFSEILREAQREVDYWRLGVFDVDAMIYDYATQKFSGLFELKAKSQVNYLNGYFLFRESQYLVTKAIAEALNVPYYWLIWNKEVDEYYIGDVRSVKVQVVKSEKLKHDAFVRLDKDSFLMLNREELRSRINQVLDLKGVQKPAAWKFINKGDFDKLREVVG